MQKHRATGPGPAHLPMDDGLTRCGKRLKGFGIDYPEQVPAEQVCQDCQRHALAGTRRAWRSR